MKAKLIKGGYWDHGNEEFEQRVNAFIADHAVTAVSFAMSTVERAGIPLEAPNVLIFYEEK